jgi:hypothetical protein
MTKDLDRVRAAEDLSPGSVGALGGVGALGVGATGGVGALVGTPAGKPIAERGSEGVAQGSTAREPLTVAAEPTPSAREPKAAPLPVPGVAVASAPELKDPGLVPPPAEPRVDARTAISDAIASCARAKLQADRAALPRQPDQAQGGKPGELTLTVSSTLSVRVGDDGYAQAARFEPPLDPTVQKCAGSTIFKVHFTEPGSVMMPVSLSLH